MPNDESLTDAELSTLRAAGYELAGVAGDPDGTVYVVFYQGDREVRSTCAEWRQIIAGLDKPAVRKTTALNPAILPPMVREALRRRAGYAPDDSSHDQEFAALRPEQAFHEFCEWHGLVGWADTLIEAWEGCERAAGN